MVTQTDKAGNGRTIAVFGASGHTGRFMVAQLVRRGFAPLAIGRDSAKMTESGFQESGVPIRTATIDDSASLDRSFAGAAAVTNCAGPFLDTADAVASAALHSRIHYLDVTAERASAQAIFDRFGVVATEAGVVVLPAMGFYGGFADLLATAAMADWDFADEIRLGIALDSWRPTQGTRITGQRNTAQRLVIEDGRFVLFVQPASQTFWDFPEPFGRQDVSEVRSQRFRSSPTTYEWRAFARTSTARRSVIFAIPPRRHRSPPTKADDRRRPSWSRLLSGTGEGPAGRSRKDATSSMPSPRHSLSKPSSGFSTYGFAAAVLLRRARRSMQRTSSGPLRRSI
jgi:NAD(P)-dependent dehydrogenase (short-subunit alcohol dehydrogenase family)